MLVRDERMLICPGVTVPTITQTTHVSLHSVQRSRHTFLPLFAALIALSVAAHAAGNSGATPPPAFVTDQCKRDVLAYQKNLEELRKNLGEKAAQEFADKFMTKEQWNDSLLRDGYCAIARGLKAARLL
jgi:hypothetical protein